MSVGIILIGLFIFTFTVFALGFGVMKIWDAATSHSCMEHQALLGEIELPDETVEQYGQDTQK